MLINSLQSLLNRSEKERIVIVGKWTAVEQQRQNAEKQVSGLQVCWCVCACLPACLPACLVACLVACLPACRSVCFCLSDGLMYSLILCLSVCLSVCLAMPECSCMLA